jgi:hypothetical protein
MSQFQKCNDIVIAGLPGISPKQYVEHRLDLYLSSTHPLPGSNHLIRLLEKQSNRRSMLLLVWKASFPYFVPYPAQCIIVQL